jgi:hypothetical protein
MWREAFSELKPQFMFCLKSTPMIALPWAAFELYTFMASFLTTEDLAT